MALFERVGCVLVLTVLSCGSTTDSKEEAKIWPSNVQHLRAMRGGGYHAPPPPGSECDSTDADIQLDVPSRELGWKLCETGPVYVWTTGNRVLASGEMDQLDAAMTALVVTKEDDCGADKHWLVLEVKTPEGTFEYEDSFYACQKRPGVIYVDNIDEVFHTLEQLSQ
jgi:hypothetical protein